MFAFIFQPDFTHSYKILAPAAMDACKEPKEACSKCLEVVGLEAELYRIGHTKARILFITIFVFRLPENLLIHIIHLIAFWTIPHLVCQISIRHTSL